MNKTFKVIWNHATQTWVATSEMARAKGKTRTVKTILATAVSALTLATSAQAAMYATTVIDGVAGQSDAHAGIASVAIGSALPYTNAQGETSTTKATAPLSIAIGLGATAAKSATLPADSTNPTNPNFADPLAAVAVGASSVASGYTSVAYGYRARATDRAAVAVGPDARAAGYASTAIGNGAYAKDMSTTALGNYAYAEGFQAVAVGASRHAEGLKATGTQAILLGTSDNADLTQAELMGPGYADGANPWSEYTGTDLGTAQPTVAESRSSLVSGKNALGIGVAVKSIGDQAIAQGYYANASSKDSIAIGTLTKTGVDAVDSVAVGPRSNITSTKSNAFGSVNTITGANSTAIGNNNVIASEKVMVLGNNVNVATGFNSAVVLGDSSTVKAAVPVTSYTYAGTAYDFAGTKPTSVVSVGAADAERQIVNVAAGQISNTSTDAINGSQLYALGTAVETQIKAVNENATKPLTFMGDTGTAFERKLGTQTNVVGGATANLTDNNIGVVADGTDTLTIKLAEKINLGTTGSVTMGDTVVNNQGLTITNGPSITNVGINAGNTTITNVSAGVNATDAVNVQQLKDSIANSTTQVVNGDGSVTVAPNATNTNVYEITVNTDGQTIGKVTAEDVAKDPTLTEGALKVITTPLTVNNSTGVVNTPANPNAMATAGDIANAINGSGFTLTAEGKNGSLVSPGETVDMKNTDSNIKISKSKDNNDVVYNMAPDVKIEKSITAPTVNANTVNVGGNAGNTALTTVAGGNYNSAGQKIDDTAVPALSVGGNQITNVANGAISPSSTDAINGSQLYATNMMVQGNVNAINRLDDEMDDMRDEYRAGIADAAAIAGLPEIHLPGKTMFSMAGSTFKGENALAIGVSSLSDNGTIKFKASGSVNTQGDFLGVVGAGWALW